MLSNTHAISGLRVEEGAGGFLPLDLGVNKFKVKLSEKDGEDSLPNVLCEGLAQAYTLAAKEGPEGHWVTTFAIRCQEVLR